MKELCLNYRKGGIYGDYWQWSVTEWISRVADKWVCPVVLMGSMFSFSDVKMMYDWGCFTDDQVRLFVPLCITDEEADKIISKEESAS